MTGTAPEYDFLTKIIIIGESGVGKTCIWYRYCDTCFCPDYKSTIGKSNDFCSFFLNCLGIEFKSKTINVEGKRAKLQIWDTCGQERFRAISRAHYRNAMGVLLCYAIDNRESFEKIEYWLEEVKKNANEKDICFVLVGTKSDLINNRVVSHEEGRKLAETHGIKFFETSAKENSNIDEAFLGLAKDISGVLNKRGNDEKIDAVATGTQLQHRKNSPLISLNCFNCS